MQKILNSVFVHFFVALILTFAIATANAEPAKSPLGLPMPAQANTQSLAQSPEPSVLPSIAPQSAANAGPITHIWSLILDTQRQLNRSMATAVKNMKSDNPIRAALALIGIAFGYGVLHAAGPGHGKSVISAYVLTNRETVRRGIALSFLSALFQALSAITFVGIMSVILRQTSLTMRSTEATIETVIWGLVATVGGYLLWRQIAPFIAHVNSGAHDHDHGPDCSCGHSHMAAPKELEGEWSWRKALPLALSVGIRPCSGAIILLISPLAKACYGPVSLAHSPWHSEPRSLCRCWRHLR